jgi:hypothetical protein
VNDVFSQHQEERSGIVSTPANHISGWLEEFPSIRQSIQDLVSNWELRRNLGLKAGDLYQAHHVIPTAVARGNALVELAQKAGWNNNAAYNGIILPGNPALGRAKGQPYHRGSHPQYNDTVRAELADLYASGLREGQTWTPQTAKIALFRYVQGKKAEIYSMPKGQRGRIR